MTIAPLSSASRATAVMTDADLDGLRIELTGALLTPGSVGYDDARKVQDVTVDTQPLAIVRAAGSADVAAAVNFARVYGLPLAVRSGGHSLAKHSMPDAALVVDLSLMKRVDIDPVSRVARVQSGVTSGELAGPALEHGLALTTGDTSSVGFGGLTTGGGIGFMVRKYGLTIDHLLQAEVVTAAGDVVTASEKEHPDLFWAIRGGGGNYGIVTEFTVRLEQVGQILGGDLLLPASREVVRRYLEYSASAPDGLSTIGNIMCAPPAPFVPEDRVGELVLSIIIAWTGDLEEGERAIAPLRALATPIADTVRPMPYPSIYLSTDHQTIRHGFAMRSMFADELSDETLDAFLDAMKPASSPYSIIHLRGLGGQLARVDRDATAFAHRDKRYLVAVIGIWLDESEDPQVHHRWTTDLYQKISHEGDGVYVNFLSDDGPERIGDAYPEATLARLRAIKRQYDPGNLFTFNQNITPSDE